MRTETITGTYGSHKTETEIFLHRANFGTWYVCKGSKNVNFTHDTVEDGTDVEEINDIDCFTWSKEIESEEDLEEAVNS
jgi:hypothetical protein